MGDLVKEIKNPTLLIKINQKIKQHMPKEFLELPSRLVDLADDELRSGMIFKERRESLSFEFARGHVYGLLIGYALQASVFYNKTVQKIQTGDLQENYFKNYLTFLRHPSAEKSVLDESAGSLSRLTIKFHFFLMDKMLVLYDLIDKKKPGVEKEMEESLLKVSFDPLVQKCLVKNTLAWLLAPIEFAIVSPLQMRTIISGHAPWLDKDLNERLFSAFDQQ